MQADEQNIFIRKALSEFLRVEIFHYLAVALRVIAECRSIECEFFAPALRIFFVKLRSELFGVAGQEESVRARAPERQYALLGQAERLGIIRHDIF